MNDEHIVSLQSNTQFLPTRLPVIVLQRVEEQISVVREIVPSAVCRQKNCIISLRICMAQRTKCFLGIVCYLTFFVVSDFMDDLLYPYGLT
jgi:hypothetical protein